MGLLRELLPRQLIRISTLRSLRKTKRRVVTIVQQKYLMVLRKRKVAQLVASYKKMVLVVMVSNFLVGV